MINYFLIFISAYLLGSIPTAVWIGKIFYHKDVRDFGSKNAGATNTFRVLGVKAGIPVMLIDVCKGYLSTQLIYLIPHIHQKSDQGLGIQLVLGFLAVLGHIYPIFASFRGGKGIATLLGIVLSIQLWSGLICLGLFVFILALTQYVSLSSILTSIAYPILIIFIFQSSFITLKIFSILVTILVFYTHRLNIKRLMTHKETKVFFLRKRPVS